jgi:hypothetical protein
LIVIGDSTTGTADDAAAAREILIGWRSASRYCRSLAERTYEANDD